MRDWGGLLWGLSLTLSFTIVVPAQAQLVPDNTLGKENSIVNSVDLLQKIDGGAIRGSNLFHSFQEFNIGNNQSVYFSNPGGIKNILTRVTGRNPSQILGKLGVLGNANLFLINPNGIIFGENAKLDINGSFIGSTADRIKFADGMEFNAANPSVNPILTISVPLGLQYGSNSGNIEVETSKLEVKNGKSLGLIGGNIKLDGGNLSAPTGEIDLFAIKNGEVSLADNSGKIELEATKVMEYGDIELLNAANIDVSGNSGGTIQIRGRNITLKNRSIISTKTEGNGSGEQLNIAATELLEINNSGLLVDVEKEASGTGSDLFINSKHLLVNDSLISVSTFGKGNSGDLNIKTTNLQIDDEGQIDVSTIFSLGNGGDLTIETINLQVYNGGQISATTFGKGAAGNVEIKANTIELAGFSQSDSGLVKSGLFASALREDGQGGNLSVTANRLIIRDGATINASNFFSFDPQNLQGGAGTGAAGNIAIDSPFILLENQAIITANANAGDKGNINIKSQNLQLRQGSTISTNARNSADGGNINIATNTLLALENSDITANSEGSFGGRVIIDAKGIFGSQFRDKLTPLSDITATSSLGASFNGVVDINTITVDPSAGLVELPKTFSNDRQNIKAGCSTYAANNFIINGKGGLPKSPDEIFNGHTNLIQLIDLLPPQKVVYNLKNQSLNTIINNHKNQIVEATGWVVDADGNIIFVAEVHEVNREKSRLSEVFCEDFSAVNKFS